MHRFVMLLSCALPALTLGACAAPEATADVPAIIVEPDAASRAELLGVVRTALHGAEVRLAADALTESSLLSIEPVAPRGLGAPPATGRQLGRPDTFNLVLDGPQCFLIHRNSGLRYLLLDTRCRPE